MKYALIVVLALMFAVSGCAKKEEVDPKSLDLKFQVVWVHPTLLGNQFLMHADQHCGVMARYITALNGTPPIKVNGQTVGNESPVPMRAMVMTEILVNKRHAGVIQSDGRPFQNQPLYCNCVVDAQ